MLTVDYGYEFRGQVQAFQMDERRDQPVNRCISDYFNRVFVCHIYNVSFNVRISFHTNSYPLNLLLKSVFYCIIFYFICELHIIVFKYPN
jgi:hypothetical protein